MMDYYPPTEHVTEEPKDPRCACHKHDLPYSASSVPGAWNYGQIIDKVEIEHEEEVHNYWRCFVRPISVVNSGEVS